MIDSDSVQKILTTLLDQSQARPYKVRVVGNNCLVGWLVANTVFSETALKIFLIFCIKLGEYKGRKATDLDF